VSWINIGGTVKILREKKESRSQGQRQVEIGSNQEGFRL